MTNIMFGRSCTLTCDSSAARYPADKKPGNEVSSNSSLNRCEEPMTCGPDDALNMIYDSELQPLVMENALLHSASVMAGTTES